MKTIWRKRSDAVVETDIDDERVAMSLESGEFFALKGSALVIWQLLDDTGERAILLARLAATYGESEAAMAPDLDAFLDQLLAAGLVEQG